MTTGDRGLLDRRGWQALLIAFAGMCGCDDAGSERMFQVPGSNSETSAAPVTLNLTEVKSLGTMEGEDPTAFGLITDALVDARLRLVVLDSRRNRLVVVGTDGSPTVVGGPGPGPGEFLEPTELSLLADGRIGVTDPRAGRVQTFEWVGDSLQLSGTVVSDVPPMSACFLGDTLVVQSPMEYGMVHFLEPSGQIAASFGKPFEADDSLLSRSMSTSLLLCLPERGEVALFFRKAPEFRVYGDEGQLVWQSYVPGFVPMRIAATENGSISYSNNESGSFHLLASVNAQDRNTALVQIGRLDDEHRTPEDFAEIDSYLIDFDKRSIAPITNRLDLVVASTRNVLVEAVALPFPLIRMSTQAGK